MLLVWDVFLLGVDTPAGDDDDTLDDDDIIDKYYLLFCYAAAALFLHLFKSTVTSITQ